MVNKATTIMSTNNKPDIVFFLIDSLRSDFLQEFIEKHPDEYISKLINEGCFFSNVISSAPYTLASTMSIFTGFHPNITGIDGWFKTHDSFFNTKIITFIEILKNNGYFNSLIYTNYRVAFIPPYAFDMFQMQKFGNVPDIKDFNTFLKEKTPKFCVLSFERIHNEGCDAKGCFSKDEYFKAIQKTSNDIKDFYKKIDLDNTLTILASDHGFKVLEDKTHPHFQPEKNSGRFVTDKTTKTFCCINYKHLPSKQINKMIRSIDIMPTVMDIIGLPANIAQGKSQLVLIKNSSNNNINNYAFSLTGWGADSPWNPNCWAIRTDEWKLVKLTIKNKIFSMRKKIIYMLFNIKEDPNEESNVIDNYPDIFKKLLLVLEQQLSLTKRSAIDIYNKNNFKYNKLIKKRKVLFKIRTKVWFNTLFRYKLYDRLKTQFHNAFIFILKTLLSKRILDFIKRSTK